MATRIAGAGPCRGPSTHHPRPAAGPSPGTGDRPRVLIVAEAANPEWVSVPLVGWSLASALREVADAHLVTQIRNRRAFLRAGLVEGRDFTAIDSEAAMRPAMRLARLLRAGRGKGWTTRQALAAIAYPHFERLVWRAFEDRLLSGAFDIVHRVTPVSPTAAGPLAARCRDAGVAFVLGPINGGVPWPPGFTAERLREREWLSFLRGAYKLLPGQRATLDAAAAIVVGSRHTQGEIPARFREKCVYLPENGIDLARFSRVAAPPSAGPLRACFVGRLVPYKGPEMLLEAAAPLMREGRVTLDIVGDGPLMAGLRAQAARSGADACMRFHGWLEHRRVQEVVAGTSLLAFPSIREFGGGVVLEAMALGVAPLVVDYAGPGELVGPGRGFKVPCGSRARIVAGLRAELARLADRPEEVAAAGERARAWVGERFTWERKAAQMREVYDWALGRREMRPDFFPPETG